VDKRLVKTADSRYKILADQILWNFTKDELVSKIAALQATLLEYQAMLADIDQDKVVAETEVIKETEK
jgi:hypothetical protein